MSHKYQKYVIFKYVIFKYVMFKYQVSHKVCIVISLRGGVIEDHKSIHIYIYI